MMVHVEIRSSLVTWCYPRSLIGQTSWRRCQHHSKMEEEITHLLNADGKDRQNLQDLLSEYLEKDGGKEDSDADDVDNIYMPSFFLALWSWGDHCPPPL